jgi:hypothetical protein
MRQWLKHRQSARELAGIAGIPAGTIAHNSSKTVFADNLNLTIHGVWVSSTWQNNRFTSSEWGVDNFHAIVGELVRNAIGIAGSSNYLNRNIVAPNRDVPRHRQSRLSRLAWHHNLLPVQQIGMLKESVISFIQLIC